MTLSLQKQQGQNICAALPNLCRNKNNVWQLHQMEAKLANYLAENIKAEQAQGAKGANKKIKQEAKKRTMDD